MAESLAEFFLANFQAHGSERAYGQRRGYRMEWFTYGQVLEMALRFHPELEARGIGKGERVMLWGENCAEWVAAFFGCALCGVKKSVQRLSSGMRAVALSISVPALAFLPEK